MEEGKLPFENVGMYLEKDTQHFSAQSLKKLFMKRTTENTCLRSTLHMMCAYFFVDDYLAI